MECRTARDRILEADPAALAHAEGALGEHLRACTDCAAAVRRILDGTTVLAAGMDANPTVRRLSPRRRHRLAVVVLAAAAMLALLLLRGPTVPFRSAPAEDGAMPVVSVPAGRNAVVFRTADPNITVVWYY